MRVPCGGEVISHAAIWSPSHTPKYYSYVFIQLHSPSAPFPSLFSWKLHFFTPQDSRKITIIFERSLEGILNKASAPVISGARGLHPGLEAHGSERRVPAGMRVLHKLCPGCLIYSCHFCLCRYKPAMLKSDTSKRNQNLCFLLRLLQAFLFSF